MAPYERLKAWQHCHQLTLLIYKATRDWPTHERFGLVAQIRRATVSASANLAEGASKRGSKEFSRYLDIGNGSLAEVEYLLRLARDLAYLSLEQWDALEAQRREAGRSVWGLYAAVRSRAQQT